MGLLIVNDENRIDGDDVTIVTTISWFTDENNVDNDDL
jgi:hypothetical protein